jgi:hypothetical protein
MTSRPGQQGLQLTWSIKEFSIDRARINAAKDRSIDRGITRGLRFIRKRSRQSIRRRKGSSKRGGPPHAHTHGVGLKTILWEFDPFAQSGVVGPVKLNAGGAKPGTTVPNVMEQGGLITFPTGSWVFLQGRSAKGQFTKKKLTRVKKTTRVRIHKRPFMVPALEFEVAAGNVAGAFTGTFTPS